MKNSRLPANIKEEDSETPWLTNQMINFLELEKCKDHKNQNPWMVHLSANFLCLQSIAKNSTKN